MKNNKARNSSSLPIINPKNISIFPGTKLYILIAIAITLISIFFYFYKKGLNLEENSQVTPPSDDQNSQINKNYTIDHNTTTSPQIPKPSPESPPYSTGSSPSFSQALPLSNQRIYNINSQPPFHKHSDLQLIVDKTVELASSRKLPIEKLSISLVDLNSEKCCDYAAYNDHELRYPASIVKLFWLVMLDHQFNQQGISPDQISPEWQKIIEKTIKKSDNETASKILDEISQTKSNFQELSSEKLETWMNQRYLVNQFYLSANYPNLNISQKTFPVSSEITNPIGPDLQIRQIYGADFPPLRNYISTYSVARLLYEIDQNIAVSPMYSLKLKQSMKRNLNPDVWRKEPYNPIAGFLAEYLPIQTNFYAKMGWTFSNRNDAAIISSADRKIKYLLVVFGDDPAFYEDKQFFPLLSRNAYQQLKVNLRSAGN